MPTKTEFTGVMPWEALFHRERREDREADSVLPGEVPGSVFLASPWVGLHYGDEYYGESPDAKT